MPHHELRMNNTCTDCLASMETRKHFGKNCCKEIQIYFLNQFSISSHWKCTPFQAIQDVNEFVSSSEQIWRNINIQYVSMCFPWKRDIRMRKWWQSLLFWRNYPFKLVKKIWWELQHSKDNICWWQVCLFLLITGYLLVSTCRLLECECLYILFYLQLFSPSDNWPL